MKIRSNFITNLCRNPGISKGFICIFFATVDTASYVSPFQLDFSTMEGWIVYSALLHKTLHFSSVLPDSKQISIFLLRWDVLKGLHQICIFSWKLSYQEGITLHNFNKTCQVILRHSQSFSESGWEVPFSIIPIPSFLQILRERPY